MLVALERYKLTVNPLLHRVRESTQRSSQIPWCHAAKHIAPVVVFSCVYYTPKFLEFNIEKIKPPNNCNITSDIPTLFSEDRSCSTMYDITSELRNNKMYVLIYINIANFIVTAVIPFISLAYLNFKIYIHMKQFLLLRQQLEDKTQFYILFAIVIMFAMCNVLRISMNIEDFVYHEQRLKESEKGCNNWTRLWAVFAVPVSEFLLKMNSSLNFFIYCFFNKLFWKAAKKNGVMCIPNVCKFTCRNANVPEEDHHNNIHTKETLVEPAPLRRNT